MPFFLITMWRYTTTYAGKSTINAKSWKCAYVCNNVIYTISEHAVTLAKEEVTGNHTGVVNRSGFKDESVDNTKFFIFVVWSRIIETRLARQCESSRAWESHGEDVRLKNDNHVFKILCMCGTNQGGRTNWFDMRDTIFDWANSNMLISKRISQNANSLASNSMRLSIFQGFLRHNTGRFDILSNSTLVGWILTK